MQGPSTIMDTSAGSVSRIECAVNFPNRGEALVSFYRHLAPLSINAALRILPLSSRIIVQPGMRSIFTPLKVGVEKPKTSLRKGDIALLASGGLICIFVQEAKSERPLNPLGVVDSGIDLIEGAGPGDTIRLSLKPLSLG